jgi:hypothetical protein
LLNGDEYKFPFVDLFTFKINNNKSLEFFGKGWDYNAFYPKREITFFNSKILIFTNS